MQATTGGDSSKSAAFVDVWIVDSQDATVYSLQGVSESDISLDVRGGRGPWRLCFQQHTAHGEWRPSAEVQLSHFRVDIKAFKGSVLDSAVVSVSQVHSVRPLTFNRSSFKLFFCFRYWMHMHVFQASEKQ